MELDSLLLLYITVMVAVVVVVAVSGSGARPFVLLIHHHHHHHHHPTITITITTHIPPHTQTQVFTSERDMRRGWHKIDPVVETAKKLQALNDPKSPASRKINYSPEALKTVVVMPFLGGAMGAGHSKLGNRCDAGFGCCGVVVFLYFFSLPTSSFYLPLGLITSKRQLVVLHCCSYVSSYLLTFLFSPSFLAITGSSILRRASGLFTNSCPTSRPA
jgi:hypothetical protein